MLQTRNAFAVLEGTVTPGYGSSGNANPNNGTLNRFSYGEIDFWVESLRKLLYVHVRETLKFMESAQPVILQRVSTDMRLNSAGVESVARLLRVETASAVVDTRSIDHSQLWAVLGGFWADKDAELCRLVEKYKQICMLFAPLPQAGSDTSTAQSNEPNSSPKQPQLSPELASRLRDFANKRRLPLEDASELSGATRGGFRKSSTDFSTAEVVLSVFAHLWDRRGSKHSGAGYFRNDCYAASSEDLHGIARLSAAIVKNECADGVHFDVFTALDDRYGPTIMELGEGRHNIYHCIIAFLIFIFKSNNQRATSGSSAQDLGAIRQTAEIVLGEVFRSRMDSTAPFAVEDYLRKFVAMD